MKNCLLGLLVLSACTPSTASSTNAAASASVTTTPPPPASASVSSRSAPSASAAPSPPPGALGIADFSAAKTSAQNANDRGVALLTKNDLAGAKTAFEAALQDDPTFLTARYDLACALSRAGDPKGAARELTTVYDADFIGFRAHADVDTDLANLWKSDHGKALKARYADYDARFTALIARGVHAIVWRDAAPPNDQSRLYLRPTLLRVGVYDFATSRFIAVAPRVKNPIIGYSPSLVPYAVVVTGTISDMLGGDMDPGHIVDGVQVYPYSTKGEAIAKLTGSYAPYSGALDLRSDGIHLEIGQPAPIDDTHYGATIDLTFGQNPKKTLSDAPPTHSAARDSKKYPATIDVGYNHWGAVVTESDAHYSYAKNALLLPSGDKIEIPEKMRFKSTTPRILASPSGDRVLLAYNAQVLTCDPGNDIPGRFKLALVDTTTKSVTSLGEANGTGRGAFDADGALYVQRDYVTSRVEKDGKEIKLPEGILLSPPLRDDPNCGF